jgi:hypothetical protein
MAAGEPDRDLPRSVRVSRHRSYLPFIERASRLQFLLECYLDSPLALALPRTRVCDGYSPRYDVRAAAPGVNSARDVAASAALDEMCWRTGGAAVFAARHAEVNGQLYCTQRRAWSPGAPPGTACRNLAEARKQHAKAHGIQALARGLQEVRQRFEHLGI